MSVLVDDARLVPLLNLHELLFKHGAAGSLAEYAVLMESEAGMIALPADATVGIVPETKGQISFSAEMNATAKSGEFNYQQNIFAILDVDILIMSLIQALQIPGAKSCGAGRHQ